MKADKTKIFSIIIFGLIIITWVFGLLNPITSDAGKYAAISKNILQSGDWINLYIHFEPYLQKPPLIFWITAPFFYIFGVSTVAFKTPILLYSIITLVSTYQFAKLYYEKSIAQLSAVILATSEFFFLLHNDIHTDTLLAANVMFAIWQIACYFKNKKTFHIILGALGIGLATITKGPIGLFVPLTATLAHLIYRRKLKDLFTYKLFLAIAVFLLVVLIGLKGIFNQFGWDGISFFLWENNMGRISGRIKGGSMDYIFYFHTALYMFLPWGVIFFIAWFLEIKEKINLKIKENAELYLLGGIIPYWIIISVSHSQSPHYFMVLAPLMSVVTAKWLHIIFTSAKYKKYVKPIFTIQYVLIILSFVLSFAISVYFFPTKSIFYWFIFIVVVTLFFLYKNSDALMRLMVKSILAVVILNFTLNYNMLPTVFEYQSVRAATEIFNREAKDGELLSTYLSTHRELFYYADHPGYYIDKENYIILDRLKVKNEWFYTTQQGLDEILKIDGVEIEIVSEFDHISLDRLTWKFLNPKTRSESLKKMYLIKVVDPLKN